MDHSQALDQVEAAAQSTDILHNGLQQLQEYEINSFTKDHKMDDKPKLLPPP